MNCWEGAVIFFSPLKWLEYDSSVSGMHLIHSDEVENKLRTLVPHTQPLPPGWVPILRLAPPLLPSRGNMTA